MYLKSSINGHNVRITEADFDRGWVYLTYIEDDTLETKTLRKQSLDSSTILATQVVIESDSRLPLNIQGYLNGNDVHLININIYENYAYFIYIQDTYLRSVRKSIQLYDTILLLQSIFQTSGTCCDFGGDAWASVSANYYTSAQVDNKFVSAVSGSDGRISSTRVGGLVTLDFVTTGTSGTYTKVITDDYGRVISGSNVTSSDIPTHIQSWLTISSTPTTLIGYGITDAISAVSGTSGRITATKVGYEVTLDLATTGTAGTYTKVITDNYGRVTSGGTLSVSDLPSHTHSHSALTNLDNDDHLQYILQNGTRAFTGDVSMGLYRITSLADGTDGNDAVNKSQLDGVAAGMTWLPAVIDISNSPPVSSTSGDRYIVGTSPVSAFSAHPNEIAQYQTSSFGFTSATIGNSVWVENLNAAYNWNGTAWVKITGQYSHTALSNLNSTTYYHLTQNEYNDLTSGGDSILHRHDWSVIDNTPTTLTGYGITDAISAVNGTSGRITATKVGYGVTLDLATTGTAGTYTKVITDDYGRVTSGGSLTSGDMPSYPHNSLAGLYGSSPYYHLSQAAFANISADISANPQFNSLGVGRTPTSHLDVYSNNIDVGVTLVAEASGKYPVLLLNGNAGSISALFGMTNVGGDLAYIGTTSLHPFYLITNGASRISISSAGNVAISTLSAGGLVKAVAGTGVLTIATSSDIPTHIQSWNTISSTPTTLTGYGITDAISAVSGTYGRITATKVGYGVTLDLSAVALTGVFTKVIVDSFGRAWSGTNITSADIPTHNQSWNTITSTPTTLTSYGITDAISAVSGTSGRITATKVGYGVTLDLATTGTAGTYTKVVTDNYGRVTSGGSLTSGDIPSYPHNSLAGIYGSSPYYHLSQAAFSNISADVNATPQFSTVQATRLISTTATGTAPLTVTSTTLVSNLNADMLDGYHASAIFAGSSGTTNYLAKFTGTYSLGNSIASADSNAINVFGKLQTTALSIGGPQYGSYQLTSSGSSSLNLFQCANIAAGNAMLELWDGSVDAYYRIFSRNYGAGSTLGLTYAGNAFLRSTNTTSGMAIGTYDDKQLILGTNNTQRMTITSAGFIEMDRSLRIGSTGSTDPGDNNLVVEGAIGIGRIPTAGYLLDMYNAAGYAAVLLDCKSVNHAAGYGAFNSNGYSMNIGIGSSGYDAGSWNYGYIYTDNPNGIKIATLGDGPIRFYPNNTQRMTITSAGYVGIDTTPTAKLHINESTSANLACSMVARGGNALKSEIYFGVHTSAGLDVGATIGSTGVLGGGLAFKGTTGGISSPDMIINDATGYTEIARSLRIGSTGSTDPGDNNLTVEGAIGIGRIPAAGYLLDGYSSSDHVVARFATVASDKAAEIYVVAEGGINDPYEGMEIFSSGYPAGTYFGMNYAGNAFLRTRYTTNGMAIGTYDDKQLILGTYNTNRITITSGGSVGIGTPSPLTNLHLSAAGNTLLRVQSLTGQPGIQIVANAAQSPFINFGVSGNIGQTSIYQSATNNSLVFTTNSTDRIIITSAGDVGIGRVPSAPFGPYKFEVEEVLYVNGFIYATNNILTNGLAPYTASHVTIPEIGWDPISLKNTKTNKTYLRVAETSAMANSASVNLDTLLGSPFADDTMRGILIVSPTSTTGYLNVGIWALAHDGVSTPTSVLIANAGNCSSIDSDTKLCVYHSGSDFIIKNRMGGTYTFSVTFIGSYSA